MDGPSTEPAGAAEPDLRRSAASGFAWTMGQAVIARLLSLVGLIVLARLLSPRDYGLVALANVFTTLLQVLAIGGLTQALVQRPRVDKLDLDSVFWSALALGVGFGIVLLAASWPLAAAFDQPQLGPVLRVLSSCLLFVGIGSTPQAVLMRDLRFHTNAQTMIAANVVATIVGIAFAFLGFGVWSLVVQTVLGIGVNAGATFVLSGYRPSPQLSLRRAWAVFDYSRHIMGTMFMNFLNLRADDFLIGAVIGPVALGTYSVAFRIIEIMNEVLTLSSRQVAYPIFARVQDDRARLTRAYTSAARMCALVAMPAFLFLLVAAPEVVPLVFGDQWRKSIPVMQILCLIGPVYAVVQFNIAVLQSIGRAPTVFRLTAAGAALQLAAFTAAVPFGIEWVAAAAVFSNYVMAPFGLVVAARELDGSLGAHLRGLAAPVIGSLITAGMLFATRLLLAGQVSAEVLVGLMAVVALASYGGILRVFGDDVLREAQGYLRALVSARHKAPASV